MSKKVSTFFPGYQLREFRDQEYTFGKTLTFRDREGTPFSTKTPMLGMTETQKVVLNWLWWKNAPPVISVSHEKPTAPDKAPFADPKELHRSFCPYAMAVATVQCLGEARPRILKVYFCDVELHEGARPNIPATHSRSKGTYVIAVG